MDTSEQKKNRDSSHFNPSTLTAFSGLLPQPHNYGHQ
jgi:hypothetical protein